MFQSPNGLAELQARYGKLLIDKDPQGGYRIISPVGWEAANMTLIHNLPDGIAKLYVNKAMVAPLTAALTVAVATCPDYPIRTIGCWNVRYKRTVGSAISVHAWGMAVDINASTNPLAAELTTDMPDAFVQAFKDQGFTWGGEFSGFKDSMHMQLVSGY
jgi:D-alanyl-D-alanine carboxypeptidase